MNKVLIVEDDESIAELERYSGGIWVDVCKNMENERCKVTERLEKVCNV